MSQPTQVPSSALTAADIAQTLPIYAHREEFLELFKAHRVIVVEGPPGCGKTTQLPRMLKQAGLLGKGIAITQPRRIAAIGVSHRIACEEEAVVGDTVGYSIRFDDCTGPNTHIKVMTDGILLQEARSDPTLGHYSTIMVDEAHERTLNIDFTLGLLHQILSQRDDLRVIVSSATLYPGHFQKFFADVAGKVPVLKIKAPVHPIEIQYQSIKGPPSDVIPEAVVSAVAGHIQSGNQGHVLVFLPGEGLIHHTEQALQEWYATPQRRSRNKPAQKRPKLRILPLFGRLRREEQERVFEPAQDAIKVVLATNIAETSITIQDVSFVIDSGLAKVPYFEAARRLRKLYEEPISKASANQRAGRAGRTCKGTVLRLYSQAAFEKKRAYAIEEIRRSDLAEVVLRLIDLNIRRIENFPFPTPPKKDDLNHALAMLSELGAIDTKRNLTDIGRQMVPFPLSPELARAVVEAAAHHPKALFDLLVVVAFLSVRSPFLFPTGREREARSAQRPFKSPLGDPDTAIRLYQAWSQQSEHDRASFCKKHYIDSHTMNFIQRAATQMGDLCRNLGADVLDQRAPPNALAICMLAGFSRRVMANHGFGYASVDDIQARLHPGSALRQGCRFVIALEIMQAQRTYIYQGAKLPAALLQAHVPKAAALWLDDPQERAQPNKASLSLCLSWEHGNIDACEEDDGHVHIDLPAGKQARDLHHARPAPHSKDWIAHLATPLGRLGAARLSSMLCIADLAPIPGPNSLRVPEAELPLGIPCDPSAQSALILAHGKDLLQPVFPEDAPSGWIALSAEKNDRAFFDIEPDFIHAFYNTWGILSRWQTILNTDHPIRACIDGLCQKWQPWMHTLPERQAMAKEAARAAAQPKKSRRPGMPKNKGGRASHKSGKKRRKPPTKRQ